MAGRAELQRRGLVDRCLRLGPLQRARTALRYRRPPWNDCPAEALTPGEAFLAAIAACGVELIRLG